MKKIALALLTALLVSSSYIGVATSQSSSSNAPGLMPRGTAALPGKYFAGDRDSGFFWAGADQVGIAAGGGERVRVSTAGLGINTSGLPSAALDVRSAQTQVAQIRSTNASGGYVSMINELGAVILDIGDRRQIVGGFAGAAGMNARGATDLILATNETIRLTVTSDGTVLIGTTTDSTRALDVNGLIGAAGGTAGAPAYSFIGNPNTGMYSAVGNVISFSANGTKQLDISGSGLFVDPGTVNTTPLNFNGTTGGIFSAGGDTVSFAVNGVEGARVDGTSTAGETAFMLYDADNDTLERVTVDAANSCGAGFKCLRIPN